MKISHKEMLMHLCKESSKNVKQTIKDTTGQSRHVDDYLGDSGSKARLDCSRSLVRIINTMNSANNAQDTSLWMNLFKNE